MSGKLGTTRGNSHERCKCSSQPEFFGAIPSHSESYQEFTTSLPELAGGPYSAPKHNKRTPKGAGYKNKYSPRTEAVIMPSPCMKTKTAEVSRPFATPNTRFGLK